MYQVIVKVGDSAGFVRLDGDNVVISPYINEALKFKEGSDAIDGVLRHVRNSFKNSQFCVATCPDVIFGRKLRNLADERQLYATYGGFYE